jgi:glucokinase
MLLAADIGGTKTHIALYKQEGGRLTCAAEQSYRSQEHSSLREIVDAFLRVHPATVTGAAFGVAGPVVQGKCRLTNIEWEVDAFLLASHLGLQAVGLLNDLEAIAYGTLRLSKEETVCLQAGIPVERGAISVIAAGTGLGEGVLFWDGRRYRALPSEGGHADFAPRTGLELDLLRFLESEFGHVSCERVLSGPGLFNIYRFLRTRVGDPEPAWLTGEISRGDPSAAVSGAALAGKDRTCGEALDMFVSIYGAEAGNLALKVLSAGGVFVAGGIAPKILPRLLKGGFLHSFTAKGRLSALLQSIPVTVVLNDRVGLLGAAHSAALIEEGRFF